MKVKRISTLIAAMLCTALAGCTYSNEDTPVIYTPPSETVSAATETEAPEQTVGEAVTGNTLMENASPQTSALEFFVYDGENSKLWYLFNNSQENEILKAISAVPAEKTEDWSPELFTAPAYGFEIGDTDGWSLEAVWSNSYWITQDGEAYRFDYDFGTFLDKYDWSDERVFSAAVILPCAHIICRDGDNWYADRLSPPYTYIDEAAPDYISAELVGQTEDKITVKYTNSGSEEWMYGLHFSVDVLLDGEWYSVPTISGNWGFNDIGLILMPEQPREEVYDLSMYGELPPGQYRISANGCIVEFTVQSISYN